MKKIKSDVQDIVKRIKNKMVDTCVDVKTTKYSSALTFWKTVQEELDHEKLCSNFTEKLAVRLRQEVLKHFLDDKRPFVRIIAQFESLPTVVFRRVLWYYNIDFKSKVSFLRRLTQEQISGIEETYRNLYGDAARVPDCFTADPKKLIRRLLYKTPKTLEDIFNEPFGADEERYARKGAIAYDFFAADMGFNIYPEEDSDEKIPMGAAKQFLKPKTKQNDFSVNREFGIYWWLYKTIRGGVFEMDIEFKDAVCPGFWYTVGMWLLILLFSPLSLCCAVKGIHSDWSLWSVIPLGIIGAVTPATLVSVGLWHTYVKSKPHIEKIFGEIDTDYWKMLGLGALIALGGSILGVLTYFVWIGMYHWNYESITLATYFTAFIWFYVVYRIHHDKWVSPTSLPVIGMPTVIFVVAKTLFDFHAKIWMLLLSIVAFIATNALELILVLSPMVVFILMLLWIINYTTSTAKLVSDEKYYKRSRLLWYMFNTVGIGFVLVSLVFLVYVYTSLTLVNLDVFTITLGLVFAFGSFTFLLSILCLSKPDEQRKRSSIVENARQFEHMTDREEKFIKELAKNTWLQSRTDYVDTVWNLVKFTERFFGLRKYPIELLTISENGYTQLEEYNEKLYYVSSDKKRERYVRYMCLGYSFDDAQKEIEARKEYWRKKVTPLFNFYNATLGQWVILPLGNVILFFWKIVRDLWEMREILIDRCPHTTRPTTIK